MAAPAILAPGLVTDYAVAHISIAEFAQWFFFAAMGAYASGFTSVISTRLNNRSAIISLLFSHAHPFKLVGRSIAIVAEANSDLRPLTSALRLILD